MNTEALIFWGFTAFVALLLLAGAVQHYTRRTPEPEPQPERHTCHVRGCGRLAYWLVRRNDTGEYKWTCIGCRDEGTAWGWWAA